MPEPSGETGSLYEHCVRAVERGNRYGVHGLPLMGSGDWNDGMNRVGHLGKGESVWDGWFQITVLHGMAELARQRGDQARGEEYQARAERLRVALEEQAWDGRWYRRAYFDDGTPLGSAQNTECRIDVLPQTWGVISGAAAPDRARLAMEAVEEMLVWPEEKMILLFAPPFDRGGLDPGYIKGYLPGIRENGGQYTHASTWVVQALAGLGRGGRAEELLNYLNPITHSSTPEQVQRYRVEPYVVVADVYGAPPHTGRGGWSWYTGSASWFYRVALESILGFHREGDRLRLTPCIPAFWKGFTLTFRYQSSTYTVQVDNPQGMGCGVRQVTMDSQLLPDKEIVLKNDGQHHEVRVELG